MQLHVIIGEDDYLVDETAKKIVGDGVGLELYDSLSSTNKELQLADLKRVEESAMTPPFFDPRKVTWWRNVHFLPGGKCAAEVKEAMEDFFGRLVKVQFPENQHFILTGPQMRSDTKLAKLLTAEAEMIVFSSKPWEAAREAEVRAIDFAAEQGFKFEAGAASQFISIVGTDTRSLKSEIAKLATYIGKDCQVAKASDVAEISSPGVLEDAVPWSVTDAVGARKLNQALLAMKRFELENGFEVFMSSMLEKLFHTLLDFKLGRLEHIRPNDRRKFQNFAPLWTVNELKIARARFLALREKTVSGITAGPVLVITELVRVMRRKART